MAEKQGIGDVVDLIKTYARQETVDPLKGAGRWVGMGLLGSVLLMIGGIAMTLALLRFVQEEGPSWTTGNLSWLPYVFTLVALVVTIAVLALRITKVTNIVIIMQFLEIFKRHGLLFGDIDCDL